MNRKKKVLSILASALFFSMAGTGQTQAADIQVTLGTTYDEIFPGPEGSSAGNEYIVSSGSGVVLSVSDCCITGDRIRAISNGSTLGDTSTVANEGPTLSTGNFSLFTGSNRVTFIHSYAPFANEGAAGFSFSFALSDAWRNPAPSAMVLLRLDTQGVTTEKNNVVSCTPGKYTFLNGGSTAETAKIQSYVYTLLVNGKAVSTLSSDNFRSVASHLFPTIAGNMAGTATLDGATWDLKGMSNYSAQCQVYATQSGGNIQSVTTAAHDAVALAAAAEAAAKVQASKNMIAEWAASNDELAKKLRDRRLAGKP
jgi:hypothetical protein